MKNPYLVAEMDIHSFDSCDIINCSDSADIDAPVDPDIDPSDDNVFVTTADPSHITTTEEEWVPTCNQGKPDYNAWN